MTYAIYLLSHLDPFFINWAISLDCLPVIVPTEAEDIQTIWDVVEEAVHSCPLPFSHQRRKLTPLVRLRVVGLHIAHCWVKPFSSSCDECISCSSESNATPSFFHVVTSHHATVLVFSHKILQVLGSSSPSQEIQAVIELVGSLVLNRLQSVDWSLEIESVSVEDAESSDE